MGSGESAPVAVQPKKKLSPATFTPGQRMLLANACAYASSRMSAEGCDDIPEHWMREMTEGDKQATTRWVNSFAGVLMDEEDTYDDFEEIPHWILMLALSLELEKP